MIYLTMHSTHFYIWLHSVGHMVKDNSDRKREKEGRKEILFNDAHSTHFILRLYSVGHMVKDNSDRKREETLCCHMGYSF